MLSLAYIRENKEEIIQRLSVKNFKGEELIHQVIELDNKRRETQSTNDALLSETNLLSKQIGELFKQGKAGDAQKMKEQSIALKERAKTLLTELTTTEQQLEKLLLQIPNVPHPNVPKGNTAANNEIMESGGSIPDREEYFKPHWDLAQQYDIIDFETGNKITGAGFPVYKGKGAKLQRALINFFLDAAAMEGYTEIAPPLLVNETSGRGTGQLPDKEGQMYYAPLDNLYLIPTAEVPITNIYRDCILNSNSLPIKNAGYTPCFRREAGSYGKEVRGLNRLHQFDKVEIVQIAHPDTSYQLLQEMVNYVKTLLTRLVLPYRIVKLCGGDLGFAAALTFDMEVYSAAQQRWLEVSSISNFETFQSNRMKIRFKNDKGKYQLVHTLNGSALALPRIMAALLENNQTKNGIQIPEVLCKYTGFDTIP